MTYPFPIRSAGNSAALHIADHNELHDRLGQALPTGLTTSSTGHLANQNQIHTILNTILGQSLPTGLTTSSTGHLQHHNTIGALLNTEIWGPRGTVGPQSLTSHPLYPGTFTATISPGATTIQTAVNAGGTNRRFRILAGAHNITSTITPHAGDQLWFDNGATVTNGASLQYGFRTVGVDNVKIMGATVSGFTIANAAGISFLDCDSVEVAYNDVSNCFRNLHNSHAGGGLATGLFVHHNNSHDATSDVYTGQRLVNPVYEDNIFTGGSGGEPKLLGAKGCRWAHNYHQGTRVGIWFDTANTDCLVEWNEITDTGQTNPMGAVCFEISMFESESVGVQMTEATRNIVRYNYIHDNYNPGILIRSSTWTEVHGNIFYQNCINNVNVAEVSLTRDGNLIDDATLLPFDTFDNNIHHNMITPLSTRRAASINVVNTADTDPYLVTNAKDNNWHHNTYDNLTGSQFHWPFGTAKNFVQWQAVPQGPGGDGAFQDINGSSI